MYKDICCSEQKNIVILHLLDQSEWPMCHRPPLYRNEYAIHAQNDCSGFMNEVLFRRFREEGSASFVEGGGSWWPPGPEALVAELACHPGTTGCAARLPLLSRTARRPPRAVRSDWPQPPFSLAPIHRPCELSVAMARLSESWRGEWRRGPGRKARSRTAADSSVRSSTSGPDGAWTLVNDSVCPRPSSGRQARELDAALLGPAGRRRPWK